MKVLLSVLTLCLAITGPSLGQSSEATAPSLQAAGQPQTLEAGEVYQAPEGEVVFISVTAGGVLPSLDRTLIIYASNLPLNSSNCYADLTETKNAVAVAGGNGRASAFFAALPGMYYCWNALTSQNDTGGNASAQAWSLKVGG